MHVTKLFFFNKKRKTVPEANWYDMVCRSPEAQDLGLSTSLDFRICEESSSQISLHLLQVK